MKTVKLSMFAVALFAVLAPSANAALLRFDFSGQFQAPFAAAGGGGTDYQGFFLIDTSLSSGGGDGSYLNTVIDGMVTIGGTEYNQGGGLFNDVFVRNDSDTFNDLFAVVVDIFDSNGDGGTIAIQLGDSTQTVFSGTDIPMSIDTADFDPFMVDNFNGTGGFFVSFGGASMQGALASATLTAVPLPAAVWFMLSGLAAIAGLKRRR